MVLNPKITIDGKPKFQFNVTSFDTTNLTAAPVGFNTAATEQKLELGIVVCDSGSVGRTRGIGDRRRSVCRAAVTSAGSQRQSRGQTQPGMSHPDVHLPPELRL